MFLPLQLLYYILLFFVLLGNTPSFGRLVETVSRIPRGTRNSTHKNGKMVVAYLSHTMDHFHLKTSLMQITPFRIKFEYVFAIKNKYKRIFPKCPSLISGLMPLLACYASVSFRSDLRPAFPNFRFSYTHTQHTITVLYRNPPAKAFEPRFDPPFGGFCVSATPTPIYILESFVKCFEFD